MNGYLGLQATSIYVDICCLPMNGYIGLQATSIYVAHRELVNDTKTKSYKKYWSNS